MRMPYVFGAILLYAMVPLVLVGAVGAIAGPVGVIVGLPLLIWIPVRAYRRGFGSRRAGVKIGVWALYLLFTTVALATIVVISWASATAQGNGILNAMGWGFLVAIMVVPLLASAALSFALATPRASRFAEPLTPTARQMDSASTVPSSRSNGAPTAALAALPAGVQRAADLPVEERVENASGRHVGDSFRQLPRARPRTQTAPNERESGPAPDRPIWDEPGRDRQLWIDPPPQKWSVGSKILLGILIAWGVVFALSTLAVAAGAVIIMVGFSSLPS